MWDTEEDYEENGETPSEYDYENPEHLDENFMDVADLPPVEGAEFIAKIEDPEVRGREVEAGYGPASFYRVELALMLIRSL